MTFSNVQVRRATVDDLAILRKLWQEYQMAAGAFEKRLTEFQIVETADGQVLGAIGLQVQAPHGKIHTEVYSRPELSPELRPRLWERVQSVARNYGLVWLWVENGSSMFWLEIGFEAARAEEVRKLPQPFIDHPGQHWLNLKVREESTTALSIEQELGVIRQSQSEHRERMVRRARVLRLAAAVVVLGVFMLMAWAAWFILNHAPRR